MDACEGVQLLNVWVAASKKLGSLMLADWALQVEWSPGSPRHVQPPPTVVLAHGIMGSKRNLKSLAKRIVEVGCAPVERCSAAGVVVVVLCGLGA